MVDLSRRPSRVPRRAREQRAYRLAVVGAISGTVAVVGILLAIFGVIGAGVPLIAAVVAVVCGLWFRSTVSG